MLQMVDISHHNDLHKTLLSDDLLTVECKRMLVKVVGPKSSSVLSMPRG